MFKMNYICKYCNVKECMCNHCEYKCTKKCSYIETIKCEHKVKFLRVVCGLFTKKSNIL